MHIIYLSLGTNLGKRHEQLKVAIQTIAHHIGEVIAASFIYETAAWGGVVQPNYLNQVIKIESSCSPVELLKKTMAIEKNMGRKRSLKWGARVIDIDILFFDNEIIRSEKLQVPHPFLHQRRFVLQPLHDIDPTIKHPVLDQPISDLLRDLNDDLQVTKVEQLI